MLDGRNVLLVLTSDDEIINVEGDVGLLAVGISVDEYAGIGVTLLEVETDQDGGNALKPGSRRLL